MAIVVVSRWKGPNDLSLAREAGPLFKKHGAVSVRIGSCFSGQYTGQMIVAVTFADWGSYGAAMKSIIADAAYQRLLAEASKTFELQDRSIFVGEEL
jgi:hypothetical protein